ncbi:ABC transporter ATP-binding protein [Bradyrhizobium sp. 31Argb]|uniref:ABC transporter ATP-binding protein n=1 Tax=unclassified Bradyrhizobium TaxID=2631580 RepID=UPI00249E63A4|nr:ABC transporter ATP-binding protein [Bradyrhizobium sp. Arg237L]MDI4234023.1 ABC transporter ATP-binding protein [Bradyrhizobium sp. Arg237L]
MPPIHLSNASLAPAVLEVVRLTLDYETENGPVRAVENVSFTVGKSERLVLLGPSGCGKSSILKTIAGFIQPTAGNVLLDGQPVKKPGPDRLVVFQEFDQLLPWKTVRENVAFPLKVARGKSASEARAIAQDALVKVGLERALDAYPHTLSGGMKQRAAIARALAAAPEILLMDEPFAALDALTRANLQNDLLELADELKFTLVFVTHAIEEAVLVGTKLHLLSAHPGRTIGTFETSGFGRDALGTAEFQDVVQDINDALFRRPAGVAA